MGKISLNAAVRIQPHCPAVACHNGELGSRVDLVDPIPFYFYTFTIQPKQNANSK